MTKIEQLLAYHRKHVFDEDGERHERAIRRIKQTHVWQAMMEDRDGEANQRLNERLTRQGY